MWNIGDVFVVAAKRTPCGSLQGSLSSLAAHELGAVAHRACLDQAGLNPAEVDEVISGCVLQAGQGQGPARQAAIGAGLPYSVAATTVNKMCGSGMISVMMACNLIKAGGANIVIAGGFECMSQAPHLLLKARYYLLLRLLQAHAPSFLCPYLLLPQRWISPWTWGTEGPFAFRWIGGCFSTWFIFLSNLL